MKKNIIFHNPRFEPVSPLACRCETSLSETGRPVQKLVFIGTLAAVLLSSCASHRKLGEAAFEKKSIVDPEVFSRNLQLAEELASDDVIAWISTDSILADKSSRLDSLDQTWFVYKEADRRYAYYGRYAPGEGVYHPKYAFVSTDGATITSIPAVPPRPEATGYAWMIHIGSNFFSRIVDSLQLDIHYNHYIRKNSEEKNYTLWFLPAGYGDYSAQGIEVRITIDAAAGRVDGYEIRGSLLRYFELDKKSQRIELDNTYDDTPTLGNLFFALRNRDRFYSIKILNKNSVTSLVYSAETGTWDWIHEPHPINTPEKLPVH